MAKGMTLGKFFFILILLVVVVGGAIYAWNRYAEATGKDTVGDKLEELREENFQLEKELNETKKELDDTKSELEASDRGVAWGMFGVIMAVIVLLGIIAYSVNQQKVGGANIDRKELVVFLHEKANSLGYYSGIDSRRPRSDDLQHLVWKRTQEITVWVNSIEYLLAVVFETDNSYGLKRPLYERSIVLYVRSTSKDQWGRIGSAHTEDDVEKALDKKAKQIRGGSDGVSDEDRQLLDVAKKHIVERVAEESL